MTTLVRLLVIASLAGYAGAVGAAGFQLMEQSASGLGNAFAGEAAVAQDATTVFTNPAGMSFLPGPQVLLGVAAIDLSVKFSNNGSSIPPALGPGAQPGGNGGNAGSVIPLPSFYATLPVGDRFSIGLGVNVPFGLKIVYDSSWIGRFQGVKSELSAINYNPAVAYKVTDTISVGAGVDYQFLQTTLTNAVVTPFGEGSTGLTAQDGAWGWNLGAIFQVSPDMRIGASYRSRLNYDAKGTVNTTLNANGASLGSFPASADVTFPDTFSLSVAQKFGDKWDMLADITFTHWDVLQQINIVNTSTNATAQQLVVNFQNAWRLALGLNYHLSETWTLRGGLAWDQSPVTDQTRTVRLPDNDRYWLAAGVSYRPSKALTFDVGYAYIWFPTTTINNTQVQPGVVPPAAGTSTVVGEYKNFANILAVQVSYTF
jgi:long-chain fatty acid transport protein